MSDSSKLNLIGCSKLELIELIANLELPAYRADQLFDWLYRKRVFDFDEMHNLSLNDRILLHDNCSLAFPIILDLDRSSDNTQKFLIEFEDGNRVESVLIREDQRLTACLSSQIGCSLSCNYCATGKIGFIRNLTPQEIVMQFLLLKHSSDEKINSIVFMGMGEPMMNIDNLIEGIKLISDTRGVAFPIRKITISTVGWIPGIETLIKSGLKVKLALSLHGTSDSQRKIVMPQATRYCINDLVKICTKFAIASGNKVSLGYLLLKGINDTISDADRLVKLAHRFNAKINLMEYNDVAGNFRATSLENFEFFYQVLKKHNMPVTKRKSKGSSISGACGQLAAGYEFRKHAENR